MFAWRKSVALVFVPVVRAFIIFASHKIRIWFVVKAAMLLAMMLVPTM